MSKTFQPKPTKGEVKAARERAGLTQKESGEVVSVGVRTWQKWEYGEQPMKQAIWELYNIKTKRR
ncbi:MAG: helix-turn-helix domain-containing protein [Devosia sp.]